MNDENDKCLRNSKKIKKDYALEPFRSYSKATWHYQGADH
jgi:hypothetical protein